VAVIGRRGIATVLTALLLAGCGAAWPQPSSASRPVPRDRALAFSLILRLPGARALDSTLYTAAGVAQALTPAQFGARYGLPERALRRLRATLRDRGVSVLRSFPQRTELRVRARVDVIEGLFAVRILEAAGRGYRVAGHPVIPSALAPMVSAVTGLATTPVWQPREVAPGGLTPASAGLAYDVAPLWRAGIDGRGMRIALIVFSDYAHSDPGTFSRRFGLPAADPALVSIDHGTFDLSGADEVNLDIDVVHAIAPRAQITVYEVGQSASGFGDAVSTIVGAHAAPIISTSWGQCEIGLDPGELAGDEQAIAAAVKARVSIFAASGDSGAYDCQGDDASDHALSVDWPAASPGVISVGGTRLTTRADGTYASESVWEDPLFAEGSGGGFSRSQGRPAWQPVWRGHTASRAVPDVSADADPGTGWTVFSTGRYGEAGGTSAAAPFWAAAMLLVEQYAARHGVTRVNFLAPLLYRLATGHERWPAFHDIRFGTNRYYAGGPGWDPATGLGSPDVYNLARDLLATLRTHHRPPRTGRRARR
jgi:subtilase family serine protease